MPTIKFDTTVVHYSISGHGPVMVWLHGYLESKNIWKNLIGCFDEHFTNICIDLLGHGDSGILSDTHLPILQAQAVNEVLKNLGVNKCTLIGHSMGGYVALAYLEEFEMKVSGIVLMNSTCYSDSEEKKDIRKRAIRIVDDQKDVYIKLGVSNLFSKESKQNHKELIVHFVNEALKTSTLGIKAALRGMMLRPDRTHVLKNFNRKKLLISGKEDVLIDTIGSEKEATFTNSNFLQLKGGHMSFLEDDESLIYNLLQFLKDK